MGWSNACMWMVAFVVIGAVMIVYIRSDRPPTRDVRSMPPYEPMYEYRTETRRYEPKDGANDPTDLHAAVHAAVIARLELARAAGGQVWLLSRMPPYTDPVLLVAELDGETFTSLGTLDVEPVEVEHHIAANDPAAVIRACEADLERLGTHRLCGCGQAHDTSCIWCHDQWPCREVLRIASVYGVEVHDATG